MRTGLSIALVLAMTVPPRPVHAGGLTREQLATLDRLIALENLGELQKAYDLAVQEFADSAASPSYRRSVINRGQVIATGLYEGTQKVAYLCTAIEMLRVYKDELLESPEDRLEIPPALERLEVRATSAAAPCARPNPPPPADTTGARAPPPADTAGAGAAPTPDPPPSASEQREGPGPPPASTPVRRTRPQIAIGSTLLITGVGLAAGFAGCFAARPAVTARIAALDAQATAAGRDLTDAERMEAAAADARYTRLSNVGTALGVFAMVGVVAGVLALALPPRASRRLQAQPTGTGIRLNF